MTKSKLLDPKQYAITVSRITALRAAAGDHVSEDGRDYIVLRSNYVGDGLYTQLLGTHFRFSALTGSEVVQ